MAYIGFLCLRSLYRDSVLYCFIWGWCFSLSIKSILAKHPIKGFLAEDEGEHLYSLALEQAHLGPCLEVGSYCGLSTVYLGCACKQKNSTLYAVDHHRGSEEHQQGEEYHDTDLYDAVAQEMNSFPAFRRTLRVAELENTVIPIVASSKNARCHWGTPLSLVFIDGGHSLETALDDCVGWSRFLLSGGILAVHDIFEHPEQGGQGPWLALNAVLASGEFDLLPQVNSLGVLRKK